MLSWLVKRPRFQLVDLICIFIATLLWSTLGHAVWWPILIALAPWILRLVSGAYPYQRTSFDLALLVFLLTAVIGFWVSYDRSAAGIKLWYIIAALFVYYALARQPKDNFWILAGGLVLLGASLSIAFLLVHDWQSQPADFDFINGIAGWWVSVRPQVSMWGFPPNQAGGILAVLMPYLLAFGWYTSKQRNSSKWLWTTGAFVSIAFVLMVFGLLMTSSRAAWLAVLFAFLMWSCWQISTLVVRRLKVSPRILYATIALLLVALSLALVFTASDQLLRLVDQIPGYPSGESRYELARNTRHLIADYPFTGGGLIASLAFIRITSYRYHISITVTATTFFWILPWSRACWGWLHTSSF